jgi:hypothetical protein
MVWNAQPLMYRRLRLENDMAADLVYLLVAPTAAKKLYELTTAEISR